MQADTRRPSPSRRGLPVISPERALDILVRSGRGLGGGTKAAGTKPLRSSGPLIWQRFLHEVVSECDADGDPARSQLAFLHSLVMKA